MVLPAPAPHDVAGPDEPDWIERIKVILRLATRGVMILVDKATPLRLGELVRALLPEHPDLDVEVDATRLAAATPRQVVVLLPNAEQAEWLNRERPIIAERQLSVILFSDAETSKVLAQRAVDFFHWISHRVECPPQAVPTFAVARLRAAMLTRPLGIVWRDGDLERVFRVVRPSRTLDRRPASLPYDVLAISRGLARQEQRGADDVPIPDSRVWLAFDQLDDPRAVRRVRWAIADARWRGRMILVAPSEAVPRFPIVWGAPVTPRDAITDLRTSGARRAGRLAALADLDPTTIGRLVQQCTAGTKEASLERELASSSDPFGPLERLRQGPISTRATRRDGLESDPIERALREIPRDKRHLAELARQAGDPDVAAVWAWQWCASQPNPRAAQTEIATAWANTVALYLFFQLPMQRERLPAALVGLGDEALDDGATRLRRMIEAFGQWSHRVRDTQVQRWLLQDRSDRMGRTFDSGGNLRLPVTKEASCRQMLHDLGTDNADPRLETQVLHELGALMRAQGRYSEAEPFLARGAALAAEKLVDGDPLSATLWSSLAQVRAQLHRDDARETADRAIRLMTRALPIDDPRRVEDMPVLERIAGTSLVRAE